MNNTFMGGSSPTLLNSTLDKYVKKESKKYKNNVQIINTSRGCIEDSDKFSSRSGYESSSAGAKSYKQYLKSKEKNSNPSKNSTHKKKLKDNGNCIIF
jgi:hypothetical protein